MCAARDHEAAILAIELLVSTQTSRLDSCPRLNVASELAAGEILRLIDPQRRELTPVAAQTSKVTGGGVNCHLFRLAGLPYSYIEMAEPAAVESSTLDALGGGPSRQVRLCHRLFAERLEKGVILRARVRGVLVDRADDDTAALQHYQAFLRDDLPLTT